MVLGIFYRSLRTSHTREMILNQANKLYWAPNISWALGIQRCPYYWRRQREESIYGTVWYYQYVSSSGVDGRWLTLTAVVGKRRLCGGQNHSWFLRDEEFACYTPMGGSNSFSLVTVLLKVVSEECLALHLLRGRCWTLYMVNTQEIFAKLIIGHLYHPG